MQNADSPISTYDMESAWEMWRERLLGKFEQLSDCDETARLYLLIDSRANPGVDKLLRQVPRLEWASLWQDTVIESYTDIAPYLVQIEQLALSDHRDMQSRLVRRLYREAENQNMLTWFWTPLTLTSLSRHLRYHSQYATPEQHKYFLHFYDNRILERLRAIWSEDQARAFVSPCIEIWYRDRDLNDVVWANSDVETAVATGEQVLSAEQNQDLYRLGHADKLVMQLRDMYGSTLGSGTDRNLYQLVCVQLQRASKYRVTDGDDILTYVATGLVIAPRFDEHPLIQERLGRAMSGSISFRDALREIEPQALSEAATLQ